VFGLQWPNVDLRSHRVTIAEALVRGERKSTKTDVVREVIQNSRALAAIQRQAKHTRLVGAEVWQDPRYGKGWVDERAFRRSYWTPTLKRLGIRYRRPYNMRHTYATMMLMAGMTPAFCAKQLGHSAEIFLRTYSKWLNGAQDALEMQRLEAALGAPAGKEATR
jgi:integrase